MDQVFREQWRRVRDDTSVWVAVVFVARSVMDLLLTAFRERLTELSTLVSMKKPLTPLSRLGWSLGGGLPVAVLVLGATILVTLSIPPTYMSSTRVKLPAAAQPAVAGTGMADPWLIQREVELIQSVDSMTRVAGRLSLSDRWSRYTGSKGPLTTLEAAVLLRNRVEVRQFRNTMMVEIRVYDQDRQLAAELANAIADRYIEVRLRAPLVDSTRPMLTDLAEPGRQAVSPNIPLNVFVGLMAGGGLGGATALGIWIVLWRRSRGTATAAATADGVR